MTSIHDIHVAAERLSFAKAVRDMAMSSFDVAENDVNLEAWNASDDALELARLDFNAALRSAGFDPDTLRTLLDA
jgi:hypothetical protein